VQADGKILVVGNFTSLGGATRNRIARLNLDGTLDTTFDPNANSNVYSLAVQADGKMLVGGFFTSLGGATRNRIARLNPDGTLDSTFDPNANNSVYSLAVQADGKILAGGIFATLGGTARSNIARLSTDKAALQNLMVSADGTAITWMRSGQSPEVHDVFFEKSANGTSWVGLGNAARVAGGWQMTGLSLPFGTLGYIRARGQTSGGYCSASTGMLESVRQYYNALPVTPTFTPTPTPSPTPALTPALTSSPTSSQTPISAQESEHRLRAYHNQINPLKGERARIHWYQFTDAPTTLRIYNMVGDLIVTLADHGSFAPEQAHDLFWNGRNTGGAVVGSGIYIVWIESGNYTAVTKIAVVK
jgi:uncharacterized delta-60 repeat protein